MHSSSVLAFGVVLLAGCGSGTSTNIGHGRTPTPKASATAQATADVRNDTDAAVVLRMCRSDKCGADESIGAGRVLHIILPIVEQGDSAFYLEMGGGDAARCLVLPPSASFDAGQKFMFTITGFRAC